MFTFSTFFVSTCEKQKTDTDMDLDRNKILYDNQKICT